MFYLSCTLYRDILILIIIFLVTGLFYIAYWCSCIIIKNTENVEEVKKLKNIFKNAEEIENIKCLSENIEKIDKRISLAEKNITKIFDYINNIT